MCLYNLEAFRGLFLSAGDSRASWVWCLSRQRVWLRMIRGPGRLQKGWSRQASEEESWSRAFEPCCHLCLGGQCYPGWCTSYGIFHSVVILPKISPAPLPVGVLQAKVIYKNETNPSLAANFKKQNEVEKSVDQLYLLCLFSISLYLLKRRRMWREAFSTDTAFFPVSSGPALG